MLRPGIIVKMTMMEWNIIYYLRGARSGDLWQPCLDLSVRPVCLVVYVPGHSLGVQALIPGKIILV